MDEFDVSPPTPDEVLQVARGIATAVAPDGGVTEVQASVLHGITLALTGEAVDYQHLEPITPAALAAVLATRRPEYRQRIVHHMVLGELVLRPLPASVAARVEEFASALGTDDHFVRVARRYAQGAYGLAWVDLRRSGFSERWSDLDVSLHAHGGIIDDPWESHGPDPELEARWEAFADLPEGTLGRSVHEMYLGRGFALPGNPMGAPAFLAQHDFVHVLADFGTDLTGELEVFALIGRADPDPKGFAWLATMIGLFATGYVAQAGFFRADTTEAHMSFPGMGDRIADAVWRGKQVAEGYGVDLFRVDFHELAPRPLDDARALLHLPPKSQRAIDAGSASVLSLEGMSVEQREAFIARQRGN
jgi:hypothetical protein